SVTILDTGARRRRGITPPRPVDLSTSAALAAREGWVKLRYSVRADGATADVRVVDAMPLGLDPSRAVAAATAWRFEPATADGKPIAWHNNLAVIVFSRTETSADDWVDL